MANNQIDATLYQEALAEISSVLRGKYKTFSEAQIRAAAEQSFSNSWFPAVGFHEKHLPVMKTREEIEAMYKPRPGVRPEIAEDMARFAKQQIEKDLERAKTTFEIMIGNHRAYLMAYFLKDKGGDLDRPMAERIVDSIMREEAVA